MAEKRYSILLKIVNGRKADRGQYEKESSVKFLLPEPNSKAEKTGTRYLYW